MTVPLRAAALEVDIRIGDVEGNLERIRTALERGAASGAQLIVLPELATSGYLFDDVAEAAQAALSRDDPRLDVLRGALPPGVVAVLGYLELDGDRLYNSAMVLTGEAIIGQYRKAHLWDRESELFEVGDSAGAVFDTPVGRLGVAICYDNEFPELPRILALRGAEVLLMPHASRDQQWTDTPQSEAAARRFMRDYYLPYRMRTKENAFFGVLTDQAGRAGYVDAYPRDHENQPHHPGAAMIFGPDGGLVACSQAERIRDEMVVATLDAALLVRERAHPNYQLRTRRPELYGELLRGQQPS